MTTLPLARDDSSVPAALQAAIRRDLRPVKALGPPSQRMVALIPVALVLLFGSVVAFGLRGDAPRLGPLLTWGASTLQMALGLVIMAAALREAVPGTALSRQMVGLAFATAVIAVVAITWAAWLTSPIGIRPGAVAYVWRICVAGTYLSALPALMLSGWLVARAFPLRPGLAGALYGLGAGLLADAGWRLFCHFSDPAHVFGSHTLAIALAMVSGVVLAQLVQSGKRGLWARRDR